MATSTVPAAKAGLLTLIQASATLTALQAAGAITWAHPGKHIQHEAIFMSDAVFTEEQPFVGNRIHRERYIIPVWVSVLDRGDDAQAAETRMWTLVGAVETAVRGDGTLGGVTNLLSAVLQTPGKRPRSWIETQGRVCECELSIVCEGNI
jgi:hypothetical protein